MRRFRGWTEQAVKQKTEKNIPKVIPVKYKGHDYVNLICDALELQLLGGFVREYKFLEDRRFRFDIAFPSLKIAIEFEGGIWSGGRHTRGKGYISDCKKYNLATMHGWKLFRFTTADTKSDTWAFDIATQIRVFIDGKQ